MAVDTTIGIWFQQQAYLLLVDQGSLATAGSEVSPSPGFRLVAIRCGNCGALASDADEASTTLAPWPPFHPQHLPMMLPCGDEGLEVCVYCCADHENLDTVDPAGEAFVCDPAMALEDAEHWWVLSWSEQVADVARIESPFDLAVPVERLELSGNSADAATSRIIAAARTKAPRMRCSAVYVVSPISGERLGAAQVVHYVPRLSALQITFRLEPTPSGTTQPKATIKALEGVDLGGVLANLGVFHFHRAGRAFGLPELSFDRLGRDAHRIGHRHVSTGFFPPVRNGDLIGIVARGIELQPAPGTETTHIDPSLWGHLTGIQVQMKVRQEDGFVSVNEDLELLQSGRLSGLAATLASACPLLDEQRLVGQLMAWMWQQVEQVARRTIAQLDGSSLRSQADLALANRHGQLGYLMYTVASAEALLARVESGRPIDDPWLTVPGAPDSAHLAALCASIARPRSSDDPSREG